MLGLLVLASLATASVLPDMLSTKLDADASDPAAADDGADPGGGGDESILDSLGSENAPEALASGAETGGEGELVSFDASVGAHLVEDFDADTDWLVVNLPADSEDLDVVSADPDSGTPPTMSWEQEDGLVELQFDALEDVPIDRIWMQFEGIDYEIALADMIEAQDAALGATVLPPEEDAPVPTDPAGASASLNEQDPEDALLPTDPELPSEPGPDGDPEGAVIAPTDPETPDDPGALPETEVEGAPLATVVADPDLLPDGEDIADGTPQPEIIRDFTPGEDLLVLDGDPGSDVLTMAAPDGSGTHVFVNDQLVATVMGVSEIDPDDIVFSPEDAAVAA